MPFFNRSSDNSDGKYVDITIQFIGAKGLPKMDVVGTADPYFVATLDDKIRYEYGLELSQKRTTLTNSLYRQLQGRLS